MNNFMKQLTPKAISTLRITSEEFMTLYNDKKIELVDVRMPFEHATWDFNFGLKIPTNELADSLDKLPKNKVIVCGCPNSDRAAISCAFLNAMGIESMYLQNGLVDLAATLRGGKAKELDLS